MVKRKFILAEWEEKDFNIKHSGVYPETDINAIEKKLNEMLKKGTLKTFKITPRKNLF